jgi:hypothetical protein
MNISILSVELGSMHAALAAERRSQEIPEAMDCYGWLVGSWDLDVVGYDDDGAVIRTLGEAHVGWVLDGRAVQDVFINPRRVDRNTGSPKFANWFGTTLRIYDPSLGAWRVNWFNPHDGIRAELVGRRQGDRIVQVGAFPDGTPIRWTFEEITADTFRWRGERLQPDDQSWRLQVDFRGKRTA